MHPGVNGVKNVLIKVFGNGTDELIDRELERNVVSALSEQAFTAPVCGFFRNGRIEPWIDGRILTVDEVGIVLQCVLLLLLHCASHSFKNILIHSTIFF